MGAVSQPTKRTHLTDDERQRTVWIMGKPYHWELVDGYLNLKAGITEYEQIRVAVYEKLIQKGVPHSDITQDMIEQIIAQAEDAAIRNGVGISDDTDD
jgi:hypothetical protein